MNSTTYFGIGRNHGVKEGEAKDDGMVEFTNA